MSTLAKSILVAIVILAVAGMADSAYALKQHYSPPLESACDFNATVSCTAVNQSSDSVLLGMPVAGIGLGGYVLIGALGAAALFLPAHRRLLLAVLLAASLGGLAFSVRLTYIELFTLNAVCPLCVLSQTLIAVITLLGAVGLWRSRPGGKPVSVE